MLETGIPQCVWRGTKIMSRLYGEIDKEKDKFMDEPDTKYQSSLDERMPSTKTFSFKNASDYNLSDRLSLKSQFTFKNADNNLLLNDQLPSEVKFRTSSGINGVNTHFDSMAPPKDYRYTDPQFYKYRLDGMTQEKFMENQWRLQGNDIKTEDLDPTSKAIRQDKERVDNASNKIKEAYKTKIEHKLYHRNLEQLKTDNPDGFKNLYNEEKKGESKEIRDMFHKNIEINKAKRKAFYKDKHEHYTKTANAKMGAVIEGNEDYKNLLQNVKNKTETIQDKYKVVKKGMNTAQEDYAEFSKRGKENKVAAKKAKEVAQEKIADEFASKKTKERQMKQWQGLNERTKKARAKGLGLIVGEDTPRGEGDRNIRKMMQSQKSSQNSPMVISPKKIYAEEVNIPTVIAQKLEDIPTDYARYINKEGNKQFVQENVEQIINAKDMLEGEKGKAKDKVPAETFTALKDNFKFLKLGPHTTAQTLFESLKTIVNADVLEQGKNSPFKKYVRVPASAHKRAKVEVEDIPESREKENKPRSVRGQVNPMKDDLEAITSGRGKSARGLGAAAGGNASIFI
jgi:hypothetical protein